MVTIPRFTRSNSSDFERHTERSTSFVNGGDGTWPTRQMLRWGYSIQESNISSTQSAFDHLYWILCYGSNREGQIRGMEVKACHEDIIIDHMCDLRPSVLK
jgi:hypothetical protein